MRPEHAALLQGHHYVVLSFPDQIADEYKRVQSDLFSKLAQGAASAPLEPHVLIRGYPSGGPSLVEEVFRRWAASTPALAITVDGLDVFPAPYKTVIFSVSKTPQLIDAFLRLETLSDESALPRWPEDEPQSIDEWRFHMSVLYGNELDDDIWADLASQVRAFRLPALGWQVHQAHLVTYDDGREIISTASLSGKSSATTFA